MFRRSNDTNMKNFSMYEKTTKINLSDTNRLLDIKEVASG